MTPLALPSNPRVLVVALRRLGDVLLTTPLIRSIKRAFPTASIEALVFAGTEGILAGNPDLAKVIAISQRPGAGETVALLRRLARRYDVALSTQTGDRPTLLAWIAGRQSAGPIEADGLSATVKRLALSRSYVVDRQQHRVRDVLRLAELLGIPAVPEIVCPAGGVRSNLIPAQPFAVVHAAPMFIYKRWTMDGWRALATALRQRGLAVVTSGASSDRAYLDEVWRDWRRHAARRQAGLAGACRHHRRRAGLYRAGHRHYPSCRRHRHADGGALRADRSAPLGALAGGRPRPAVGGRRHHPAARQCVAGAKPLALPAVPARGL